MSLNEIIKNYIVANEQKKQLEKQVNFYKSLLMDAAKENQIIETENYLVTIGSHTRENLDTKKLYIDFPDIKQVYNKVVSFKQIDSIVTKETQKASA